MDVIFSDNHILVVAKPAGLLTQPTKDSSTSLEEQAKEWIRRQFNKQGNVFLHAVHRLDKDVSGLVLFAKTSKALSRLNEAMRQRSFQKTYFAWVEGALSKDEALLEHYLIHEEHRSRIVETPASEAKHSTLSYKVLQKKSDRSFVEIDLHSGRYHQIRAQFAHEGHPLLGDRKYGAKLSFLEGSPIALHQGKIQFAHPVTQEEMVFECPLPKSWQQDLTQ